MMWSALARPTMLSSDVVPRAWTAIAGVAPSAIAPSASAARAGVVRPGVPRKKEVTWVLLEFRTQSKVNLEVWHHFHLVLRRTARFRRPGDASTEPGNTASARAATAWLSGD